jgi:hypothetical protein
MDPQATLDQLLEAVGERDWDRTEELADALLRWMAQRGFPPLTLGPETLGKGWHRAVATFACYAAKSKVRDARKRRRKKHE